MWQSIWLWTHQIAQCICSLIMWHQLKLPENEKRQKVAEGPFCEAASVNSVRTRCPAACVLNLVARAGRHFSGQTGNRQWASVLTRTPNVSPPLLCSKGLSQH